MLKLSSVWLLWPFPGSSFISFDGLSGKESACNAGNAGQSLGREDPLEKEMAAHSSIPAGRIPWTEETGGLHGSMGLQSWTRQRRCTWTCANINDKLLAAQDWFQPLLHPCFCSGLGFSSPNIHPSAFGNPLFFRTSSKSLSFTMFPFSPQLQMNTTSPFAICLYVSSR